MFGIAIFLQWLLYHDWIHWKGPLQIVGSTLAGALTTVFTAHCQSVCRKRRVEALRRLEAIVWMTDSIRNALQAIECIDYLANPPATDSVRNAAEVICRVLQKALDQARPVSVIEFLWNRDREPDSYLRLQPRWSRISIRMNDGGKHGECKARTVRPTP